MSFSSSTSSLFSQSGSVGCLSSPSLLLAPVYRKKNYSKQLPRELYLRSDLPCCTALCGRDACRSKGNSAAQALAGGVAPSAHVLEPTADHYVIPSFLALQRFTPWFARATQVHLILLRTHAALAGTALTRSLRSLLSEGAPLRRAVLFENESHTETATIYRSASRESNEARNARAVRRATRWFSRHLNGNQRIILIEAEDPPTEESVRREQEDMAQPGLSVDSVASAAAAAAAPVYPRQMGDVMVHSMDSYLRWLEEKDRSASSASTSAVSSAPSQTGSPPSVSDLIAFYHSLLDAERSKVKAKLSRLEADSDLEAKLATCKLELTRGLSLNSASAAAAAAASTAAAASAAPAPVSSPSLQHAISLPAPATKPSAKVTPAAPFSSELEFEEHLPLPLAREALRRGLLYSGHLRVNKYHAQHDASLDLGGRMIDATTGQMVESSGGASSLTEGSSAQRLGEIFISGSADRNRAIDGDEVVVQLLPVTLWRATTQRKKIAVRSSSGGGGVKGEGDEDDDASSAASDASVRPVPTGRVVAILQRNTRPYVCTLQLDENGSRAGDYSLVVPMNECIPKIRIRTHQTAALANQRLLVSIDEWPADSKYPSGIYQQSLGRIGSVETGVKCILHELQISHPPWSLSQLRCLPPRTIDEEAARDPRFRVGSGFHPRRPEQTPFSWTIPPEAMQGRLDLRSTHRTSVCSIDPIGCEDIDDALSVLSLPNGNVQIGVHIADVSFFVPEGSLLSEEASRRGTSVYLTDRRLDMLPGTLSSDLCSLRGGCDRLCLSVLWEISPSTGEVQSTWYGRTAIHNSFALSYEEAQFLVDTEGGTKPLEPLDPNHPNYRLSVRERYDRAPESNLSPEERQMLYPKIRTLLSLARLLKSAREQAGALELHSLETKFTLDDEKNVVGITNEPELEVHKTIAEWMVFANSTVAHAIWARFPRASLLRHHPFPAAQRFERLLEMAKSLGISIDTSSNKSLAASLHRAEEELQRRDLLLLAPASEVDGSSLSSTPLDAQQQRSWQMKLLKELAARAMSEAQYFSTGAVDSPREFYHYGLAANFYTHFTSPIRRYADLVVHRQLLAVIEMERAEFRARKAEVKALKAAAGSSALRPQAEQDLPTLSHRTGGFIAPPPAAYASDQLQTLARHLNAKNRAAKIAGMESQSLFLACFLAGEKTGKKKGRRNKDEDEDDEVAWASSSSVPRSLVSTPAPSRVERCEALIVSLRSNGFIVLLPSYNVKGALPLVDRDGNALVAHPLAHKFREEITTAADEERRGGPARVTLDEAAQTLTLSLSSVPSPPPTAAASPLAPLPSLPLSRTFRVFEPVVIDVSLRPGASRYRTPKPVFTLVWQSAEKIARKVLGTTGATSAKGQKDGAMKAPSAASAAPASAAAAALISPALTSAPAAPAGAKQSKSAAHSGTGALASSPLYFLLREAASSTKHSKVIKTHVAEEKKLSSQGLESNNGPNRRVRLRHRVTGALGGRVLHTPTGLIPQELTKNFILKQQAAQGQKEDEDEFEEYYSEHAIASRKAEHDAY